jgi:hypothetical protein
MDGIQKKGQKHREATLAGLVLDWGQQAGRRGGRGARGEGLGAVVKVDGDGGCVREGGGAATQHMKERWRKWRRMECQRVDQRVGW